MPSTTRSIHSRQTGSTVDAGMTAVEKVEAMARELAAQDIEIGKLKADCQRWMTLAVEEEMQRRKGSR